MWGQNSEGERQSLLCSAQNSVSKMSSAPRHKKQKKNFHERKLIMKCSLDLRQKDFTTFINI